MGSATVMFDFNDLVGGKSDGKKDFASFAGDIAFWEFDFNIGKAEVNAIIFKNTYVQ